MVNESKYEYLYYTFIDVQAWIRENENISSNELNYEETINFIEKKFKQSTDSTVNNFRVQDANYCDDIDDWIKWKLRMDKCPVFVRFQQNQQIKKTGSGQLFILYEVDDDGCDLDRSYINTSPDDNGLSRYGGRL